MDLKNLVYNGDFENGNTGWDGMANGTVTVDSTGNYITMNYGSLQQNTEYLFPVANDRTYTLSFDLKVNTVGNDSLWVFLHPYSSSKTPIGISTTNKRNGTNTHTTLAADLKSGDTTVTLTSAANWETSYTYQRIGICDIPAYGYNRCRESYPYSSVNGNVLTLSSAYSGSTIPAGTKVAEFADGSAYYYPYTIHPSELPTDWKTYSVEFTGGDSVRYSTKYVNFGILGYAHNYSIRNVRVECISDLQYNEHLKRNDFKVKNTGVVSCLGGQESGMYIRYVSVTTNGSTANAGNHMCEIQAFNSVGENIAWNKPVNGVRDVRTDGSTNVDQYVSTATHTVDLEFAEYIHKLKIWYYYYDGRTYYDKKVKVSLDGTNWIEVYSGEKPETADGLEIILHPEKFKINKNGTIYSRELYEF